MRLRLVKLVLLPVRLVCRALPKLVITGAVFIICLLVSLRLLGVPAPQLSDVLERIESISQLAEALP
jgi:hypothetical protein